MRLTSTAAEPSKIWLGCSISCEELSRQTSATRLMVSVMALSPPGVGAGVPTLSTPGQISCLAEKPRDQAHRLRGVAAAEENRVICQMIELIERVAFAPT